MGRKRNNDVKFTAGEMLLFALLLPIAIVAAYPILLIPIVMILVIYMIVSTNKMILQRKKEKAFKENFPEFKPKDTSAKINYVPEYVKDKSSNYKENPYILFEPQIKRRGKEYYKSNKVINFRTNKNNTSCTAEVLGTKKYNVTINFNNANEIKEAMCTCPYYEEEKLYCKHIYATLLKCQNHNNKIKNYKSIPEILELIQVMEEQITKIKEEYYKTNSYHPHKKELEYLCNRMLVYEGLLKVYKNTTLEELSEKILKDIKKDQKEVSIIYDEIMKLK